MFIGVWLAFFRFWNISAVWNPSFSCFLIMVWLVEIVPELGPGREVDIIWRHPPSLFASQPDSPTGTSRGSNIKTHCVIGPRDPQILVFLSLCNSVPWSLGCLLSSRTGRCNRMTLTSVLLALPLSPFWLTGFDEIRSHVSEVHMTRDLAWALASHRLNTCAPPPNSYLESLSPSVMVCEVGNN